MFDSERVKPIRDLFAVTGEPTNEQIGAAANVALDMFVALVNAVVKIADNA